jgi:hypothetical protein
VRRKPREAIERLALPLVAMLACGLLLVVLVAGTGGGGAAFSAAIATLLALALVVTNREQPRAEQPAEVETRASKRGTAAEWALVPVPGLLVLYLSFNGGGYFPGNKGLVAFLLALAIAARIGCARAPFGGFTRTGLIAAAGLTGFALWTLVSGSWSHAGGRALVEADQALVYALTLVLFTSVPRSSQRLRWMVRGVALAAVAVSLCGLVTRVLPDVWPIAANLAEDRLSYPLTYWNALGILATLGALLCLGITSSTREPPAAAVAAAAGVPIAATTLLFTFSRGAIAAAAVGMVALVVIGRSRGLVAGLIATLPASAVAVVTAYNADLLAKPDPTTVAAAAQGHHVAWVVAACAAGAAILRLALIPLDRRLATLRLPARMRRPVTLGAWAAAALVVLVALIAAHGPIGRQYDRFVQTDKVKQTGDLRARLTDPGNNHRIDQWRVGRDAFEADPLKGNGAGTYQTLWARNRPDTSTVVDAHSLYVEVLAELGVVGLALLLLGIGAALFRVIRRASGANRSLYAAIAAAGVAWAVHAGIDWDWEMPAVSLPIFALGASAVARSRRRAVREPPRIGWRAAAVVAAVVVALLPLLLTLSQHYLDQSRDAAGNGDCTRAIDSARSSLDAVGQRAEPYQVIAYCEQQLGRGAASVAAIRAAVKRDPEFWRYRYDQSLLEAAAGLDPRAAAQASSARDPRELSVQKLNGGLAAAPRSEWRSGALRVIRAGAP